MPFTPPNHARALFYSLFFAWLYIASVLWWHAATLQPLDPLSLAEGSLDLGVLVYGVIVVHRLFWVNLFPFSYQVSGTFLGAPTPALRCGVIAVRNWRATGCVSMLRGRVIPEQCRLRYPWCDVCPIGSIAPGRSRLLHW